ncbi:replication-associated protein [Gopherus associated circular DNA virus 4]|nr:replication-associated protein [Gopherus associated circular DNA virus 4]
MVPNFRVNARVFFLTYPRCPVPSGECLRLIRELSGQRLEFICVGHERHRDGGDHLHVVFQVKRKWDVRNQRKFDITTADDIVYHCNIQAARDASHVYRYVRKAGDYEEWGTVPPSFLSSTSAKPNKRDAAFAALDASATTVEDFMSELRTRHPYEFFTRGNTIRANVEQVKRRRWEYTPKYHDFNIPGGVQDWLDTEFAQEEREDRPRSLMLVGPSKTGKTEWARSLGRHMYFRENFSLDDWDDDADYVIFDDLPMEKVPGWKVWLGSMGEMVLYDRYRPKMKKYWGPKKCCIILCNPGVDWRYSEIWKGENEWCTINVEVINITQNLY